MIGVTAIQERAALENPRFRLPVFIPERNDAVYEIFYRGSKRVGKAHVFGDH